MLPLHLDNLKTIPTLCMGLGAVFWIPLSIFMGRRPVLLASGVTSLVAICWAGFAGSFYSLLAALCLQAFAYGFVLSTVRSRASLGSFFAIC
jgi:hypothetical protein